MRILFKQFLVLFILLISWNQVSAQYGYFYDGKDYGSESALSPINQILNGSFDMLQTVNYTNRINDLKLEKGFKSVFNSLVYPIKAINIIGWKKFVDSELVPFGFTKTNSQWLPNYGLHLFGGGMEYARMTDYYKYHGLSNPRIWATLTSLTEQFINEAVEAQGSTKLRYSITADFYFFNIPGIILFSFEPVQRFFSEKIIIRSWLGQASLAPQDFSLRNTGQYYSIKIKPKFAGNFSYLYYMGAGWLNGVGYEHNELTYSLTAGIKTEEVIVIDEKTDQEFIKATPSAGFFIDKNNSLLFSLVVATHKDYKENIKLDLYPGVLKINKVSFGLWASFSFKSQSYIGLTFKKVPGITKKYFWN